MASRQKIVAGGETMIWIVEKDGIVKKEERRYYSKGSGTESVWVV